MKVRVSGTWKDGKPYVRVSGVWRNVKEGFVRVAGAWEIFYSIFSRLNSTLNIGAGNDIGGAFYGYNNAPNIPSWNAGSISNAITSTGHRLYGFTWRPGSAQVAFTLAGDQRGLVGRTLTFAGRTGVIAGATYYPDNFAVINEPYTQCIFNMSSAMPSSGSSNLVF